MTEIGKHRVDEPIDLLLKTLQDLLDQVESMQDDISQEKLHRISRLYTIFCDLMEQAKQQNLELEHEFYESAALLVDQILITRASNTFMEKAISTDLLQTLSALVAIIYEAVYRSKYVIEALGNVPHVSHKLLNAATADDLEKVMSELWAKVAQAEHASDLADKQLSETVSKVQDLYDTEKTTELPDALMKEFVDISLKSYAIGAAATLTLEELELAKDYFHSLQNKQKQ